MNAKQELQSDYDKAIGKKKLKKEKLAYSPPMKIQ